MRLPVAVLANLANQPNIAVFNFGHGSNETSINITGLSTISSTARIDAYIMADDFTIDHTADDHKYAALLFRVTASPAITGVGFTLYARSPHKMTGTFKVRYVWVN